MTKPLPVTFLNNPHSPDVFSTDATGFVVMEGTIGITFESSKIDHSTSPGPTNRVVIGRLVMPIPAAQRLALGLYDFLEKQGLGVPKKDAKEVQ
jgi:hypothetical protein